MAFTPSAQRQFLVKVAGIDGFFSTKTGGNISADTTKVYDGGDPTPYVLAAPAEAENVTVGRPFDPNRDSPLLARLRNRVGRDTFTVSVTPTDRDYVVIGAATVYPDALLVAVNEPEADASSGDAATLELEFAVASFV
jgi:hypothetical protein